MNRNIIIVLGGAVVIAIAVAMIVQLSVGGKEDVKLVQEERVEILVAAKDLKLGAELGSGDARWQPWPKAGVFSGAIVRKTDLTPEKALEGRLARNVAKGEPLMPSVVLGAQQGNFVSASLGNGMRAVAVNVSASSMVGGFIGPGDFVDVILVYKEKVTTEDDDDPRVLELMERNLDKFATETIIQNIKVLAVDQTAQRPEDNKIRVGKTVTVAVTVQDAERLALASEMGELIMALRGVGDDVIVEKSWPIISDARLTHMTDEIFDEYRKIKNDSGSSAQSVRIYNGASMQMPPSK